ncbi:MAG: protein kinase domain-containing protein [Vicinamibacterales bacterium]
MSDAPTVGASVTRLSRLPADSFINPARFTPGETIARRYRIVALLGRGGMGEVYRADDLRLGQSVALKFLPLELTRDEEWLARFQSEIRLARLVSHPNVCRVHDIGDVDGHPFLSMEYIDGEDLASLLRRIGRLPEDKARDVARQLCAGLAAAHDQGVIHRDLKPANVMLDGRGNIRITDFGLAGLSDQLDRALVGTPAYMAPELFTHAPASVQSDLYALGLVLYEVFSGRSALPSSTIDEMGRLQREFTPPRLTSVVPDVDPLVDRIVFQCLAKDPAQRPLSALGVSSALPGSDPLALALARGETPSPEAVAGAVRALGIHPVVAVACLAAIAGGLAVAVALSAQTQLVRLVPLDRPPAVLMQQGRDAIAKLGYPKTTSYAAFGFLASPYSAWLGAHDLSVTRWERLRQFQPPGLTFWFRQSRAPLTRDGFSTAGQVAFTDPPLTTPGTVGIVLDLQGKLRFLSAAPADDAVRVPPATVDWNQLFAEAGFDITRFTPVPSTRIPPVYADERRAWNGTYVDRTDVPIHVEAAAIGAQPVYFEIFEPWDERSLLERLRPEAPARSLSAVVLTLLFVAGTGSLARRHLLAGRGDRSGAIRLAMLCCALQVAAGLLRAAVASLDVLMVLVARGLLVGAGVWIAYMALEPFLRRYWPSTMISWTRLMAGGVRDPLVGRDLLIGVLTGVVSHLVWQFSLVAPKWIGLPPGISLDVPGSYQQLQGVRFTAAAILSAAGGAVLLGTSVVLLFFVLSLVVRKRWLVAVALPLVIAAVTWSQEGSAAAAFVLITYLMMTTVLLRFGLLALVASAFVTPSLDYVPLTMDAASWYAPNSWLLLIFVTGLAVYAFRTALAGRPILSGAFFHVSTPRS